MPPSATLEYYERIVDMFEYARMTEYPVISLGEFNLITFWMRLNLVIQSTILKLHNVMHQLTDQPTRVHDETSSVLDVILTSHPALHHKSVALKHTLSDHYLIYTHMEFENTKPLVVDHSTVKFRDMGKFRHGEFLQWSNFVWHTQWFPG